MSEPALVLSQLLLQLQQSLAHASLTFDLPNMLHVTLHDHSTGGMAPRQNQNLRDCSGP